MQEGPCTAPDEPIYIYSVRHDGNNWTILDFQDPNQSSQVTGYNVYRSSSPGAPWPWTLVGSDVRDMDAATANNQWVDQSGDPGTWYYQVNAYNSICNARDRDSGARDSAIPGSAARQPADVIYPARPTPPRDVWTRRSTERAPDLPAPGAPAPSCEARRH